MRQCGGSVAKTILKRIVDDGRRRSRPAESWMTIIIEGTRMKVVQLGQTARHREAWKTFVERSAVGHPQSDDNDNGDDVEYYFFVFVFSK